MTLGNPQTFGFDVYLRPLPCALSRRLVKEPVALLFAAIPHCRDPTRLKQLSMVAILGFQFGLYHVVVL